MNQQVRRYCSSFLSNEVRNCRRRRNLPFTLNSKSDRLATMKLRSVVSTTAAAATSVSLLASSQQFPFCNGWISPYPATRHPSVVPLNTRQIFGSKSTQRMSSTAAVEDEEVVKIPKVSESLLGKTIAEGKIVSRFPGGLTAIRINEEFAVDDDNNTITLSTDGLKVPMPLSVKVEVGDYQGKQVVFADGTIGVVIAHRPPLVYVYTTSDDASSSSTTMTKAATPVEEGHAKVKNAAASIDVSPSRKVVGCFGQSIATDDKNSAGKDATIIKRLIFSPIPQVKDIALINNPMLTGITMVDTIASIGRGQNMLLVGHNLPSMRAMVIDFLRTQISTGENTKCIYAATDESCDDILDRLTKSGIVDDVHLVARKKWGDATKDIDSSSKAAEAVSIAATACAIGEAYALEHGTNSLVIIDTIDQHKKLWDCSTRVMIDVFGADAVVKSDRDGGASSEMRGFFSSLIQRSAQYKVNRGGGSVTLLLMISIPEKASVDDDNMVFSPSDFETAPIKTKDRIDLLVQKNIPLTATTLRRINIPIPSAPEGERRFILQHVDDLISMSDGQIWLDEGLEGTGRQPPVDPQRSITRIGIGADTPSRADAPAIRRIAEGLRLELSQAADIIGVIDSSREAQVQSRKQRALLLAMHQVPGSGGRRLSESCVVLLAARKGYLDKAVESGALAGTEQGETLIDNLLHHVHQSLPDVMSSIDTTFDMNDNEENALNEAIRSFLV